MEISEDNWKYKVAYGANDKYFKPTHTNLCSFFWKFVLMLFVGWPVLLLLGTLLVVMSSVGGFLFAHKSPYFDKRGLRRGDFAPYKKWPTIKGYRILPIYFVVLTIVPLLAYDLVLSLIPIVTSPTTWIIVGVVTLIVAITAGFKWALTLEAYQLLKNYLAAKKAKVCPIIKFTRKAETTN